MKLSVPFQPLRASSTNAKIQVARKRSQKSATTFTLNFSRDAVAIGRLVRLFWKLEMNRMANVQVQREEPGPLHFHDTAASTRRTQPIVILRTPSPPRIAARTQSRPGTVHRRRHPSGPHVLSVVVCRSIQSRCAQRPRSGAIADNAVGGAAALSIKNILCSTNSMTHPPGVTYAAFHASRPRWL